LPASAFLDGNMADIAAMNFVGRQTAGFLLAVAQSVPHVGTCAEYNSVMFSRHFFSRSGAAKHAVRLANGGGTFAVPR
jgi:hypothetical protein